MTDRRSPFLPLPKALVVLLLSGLLFLQAGMSGVAASSVASEAGVSRIVICGAGGMTTITIAADGSRTVENGGEREAAQCPFCLLALADLPERAVAALAIELRQVRLRAPSAAPLARIACVDYARAIRAPPRTV